MSNEMDPNLFEPEAANPVHQRRRELPVVALLADLDASQHMLARAVRERTLVRELVTVPVPSPRTLGLDEDNTADMSDLLALECLRVDLSTYVLVVSPSGYLSPLTRELITHASRRGKAIFWWSDPGERDHNPAE